LKILAVVAAAVAIAAAVADVALNLPKDFVPPC
jgi:hypothetical protein